MHIKDINDLMAQINELYGHIKLLERIATELKGKDAERLPQTITNLRLHIVDLERLL